MSDRVRLKVIENRHFFDPHKYDYSELEEITGSLAVDVKVPPRDIVFSRLKKAVTISLNKSVNVYLPVLEEVTTFLVIEHSKNLRAPKLKSIGSSLYAEFSKAVHLPSLERVSGKMELSNSKNFYAPLLKYVGAELHIYRATGFVFPLLNEIKGELLPVACPEKITTEGYLKNIEEAPIEQLPLLLLEYNCNPFLVYKVKQRLQGC